MPDVDDVIHSLSTQLGGAGAAGIGQFTSNITAGFAFNTNYDAALTNMNAAFASQGAGDVNTGFFLSDGIPTTFTTGAGSPLQAAVAAGTKILTFGIGGGAPNSCDPGAPLRTIADATGGTCTEVADPSDLVQPRGEVPPYTARRTTVLDKYRKGEATQTTDPTQGKGKISDVGQ